MTLSEWATKHNISAAAMDDYRQQIGMISAPLSKGEKREGSEARAQSQEILKASELGGRLWRNNVGATESRIYTRCKKCGTNHTAAVQPVRYGLCNESKNTNKVFKSSDLIGIKPVTITPNMVGGVIGQFWSREMKKPSWKYKGDDHEIGQLNWLNLILSLGGDAAFSTGY